MNRDERIVVVGGGLTGLRAAERLRELKFEGEITILGDEKLPPYHRPALSKQLLQGALRPSDLTLPAYEDLNARWRFGTQVRQLIPNKKTLVLPGGEEMTYDGLIIATGVEATRQSGVPYHDPRVLVLRTMADGLDLERVIGSTKGRVAVVGGGFTGCELAASLRHLSRDVTLIGRGKNLLGNVLGPDLGEWLTAMHRDHGVDLALGNSVEQWAPGPDGIALKLTDGSALTVSCVILAAGTKPMTHWLRGSGLPLDNGVVCEPTCHVVGADDVVAAGDVAQWPNLRFDNVPRRVEHWLNAVEMGRAAAENLLAGREKAEPFCPMPRFWTDQYSARIQAAGMLKLGKDIVKLGTPNQGTGTVYGYSLEGRLMGVVGVDCPTAMISWGESVSRQNPAPRPRVPAAAEPRASVSVGGGAGSKKRTGKHSLPGKDKNAPRAERREHEIGYVEDVRPAEVSGPIGVGAGPAPGGRPKNVVDSFSRMLPVAVRPPHVTGADGRPPYDAAASGRFPPVPAGNGAPAGRGPNGQVPDPSASGRFPAVAPGQFPGAAASGRFPAVSSGRFPAESSGRFPAAQPPAAAASGQFPAVSSGRFPAVPNGQSPTASASGRFPAVPNGQSPTASASGRFPAVSNGQYPGAAASGRFPAVSPGQGPGAAPSGRFPHAEPPSGRFPAAPAGEGPGAAPSGRFPHAEPPTAAASGRFPAAQPPSGRFPAVSNGSPSGRPNGQFPGAAASGRFPAVTGGSGKPASRLLGAGSGNTPRQPPRVPEFSAAELTEIRSGFPEPLSGRLGGNAGLPIDVTGQMALLDANGNVRPPAFQDPSPKRGPQDSFGAIPPVTRGGTPPARRALPPARRDIDETTSIPPVTRSVVDSFSSLPPVRRARSDAYDGSVTEIRGPEDSFDRMPPAGRTSRRAAHRAEDATPEFGRPPARGRTVDPDLSSIRVVPALSSMDDDLDRLPPVRMPKHGRPEDYGHVPSSRPGPEDSYDQIPAVERTRSSGGRRRARA